MTHWSWSSLSKGSIFYILLESVIGHGPSPVGLHSLQVSLGKGNSPEKSEFMSQLTAGGGIYLPRKQNLGSTSTEATAHTDTCPLT